VGDFSEFELSTTNLFDFFLEIFVSLSFSPKQKSIERNFAHEQINFAPTTPRVKIGASKSILHQE